MDLQVVYVNTRLQGHGALVRLNIHVKPDSRECFPNAPEDEAMNTYNLAYSAVEVWRLAHELGAAEGLIPHQNSVMKIKIPQDSGHLIYENVKQSLPRVTK